MISNGLKLSLKILLLLNHQEQGGAFFKEIVARVDRDKGQVSNVLKKLANEGLIVKENGKPKRIVITETGKEMVKGFLVELQQPVQAKDRENEPQKFREHVLDKQELLEQFIVKLRPRIKEDLNELSQYLTADTLNALSSELVETVENLLYSTFERKSNELEIIIKNG